MSFQMLLVRSVGTFLVLVGLAAAVNATCENARCLRFYNAECRDDLCDNPPCEPSFFWNNRNVTDRCHRESCDTKRCRSTRQCMEEVITASCKAGINCRQFVRARCVLIEVSRPMDCSDITCDPGHVCRLRVREGNLHPIVRCIPMERLISCENIQCDPGFYCREDQKQVTCVPNPTTEESTEQTEAPTEAETEAPTEAETEAPTEAETEEPSTNATSTEQPTQPGVASPCEALQCPQDSPFCQLTFIQSYNTSVPSCQTEADFREFEFQVQTNPEPSCSRRSCMADEVCIDYSGDNLDSGGYCSRMDCDPADNSGCPLDAKCVVVPAGLNRMLGNTHCVPEIININYNVSCSPQTASMCEFGTYCADISMGAIPLGSYCSPVVSGVRTCNEIVCPETFECIELSYDGQPSLKLSTCIFIPPSPVPTTSEEEQTTEAPTAEQTEGPTDEPTPDTSTAERTEEPTDEPTDEPTRPSVASSCEELNCPRDSPCQLISIPSYNTSEASCQTEDDLREFELQVQTNPEPSCSRRSCMADEVCIDHSGANLDSGGYCSRMDCDPADNSSCPLDAKCVVVPAGLNRMLGDTHCVPEFININYNVSCSPQTASMCEFGTYCADISMAAIPLGSYCSPVVSGVRTCDEIVCPEYLTCSELSYADRPSLTLSTCTFIPSPPVTPPSPVTSEAQTPGTPTDMPPDFPFSCEDLSCPPSTPYCQLTVIPSFNTSVASCHVFDDLQDFLTQVQVNTEPQCSTRSCMPDEVCIDYSGDNLDSGSYCSRMNCDPGNSSTCPSDAKCDTVPTGGISEMLGGTQCVPVGISIDFGVSCNSSNASNCELGTYCADLRNGDILIGSYCSPVASGIRTCDEIECPELFGFLCFEISYEDLPSVTLSTCVSTLNPSDTPAPPTSLPPSVARSCDELRCPANAPFCQLTVIPSRRTSDATCQTKDELDEFDTQIQAFREPSCFSRSCMADEVCIDFSGRNLDSLSYCSRMDCDPASNTSCPLGAKCVGVPTGLNRMLGNTLCVPENVDINFNTSCSPQSAPMCEVGTYCADVSMRFIQIGSYCSPLVSGIRTCNEIVCPETFECVEISYDIRPLRTLTSCIPARLEPPTSVNPTIPVATTIDILTRPPPTGPPRGVFIALTCEELTCPALFPICQMTHLTDLNITVASCVSTDTPNTFFVLANITCESMTCEEGQVCIDSYGDNVETVGFCSTLDCSLSDNSTCPLGSQCVAVPSNFEALSALSACIPDEVDFNFGVSCESEDAPKCDESETCANSRTGEEVLGSYCTDVFIASTTRRCSDVDCPRETQCTEITFDSVEDFRYITCLHNNVTQNIIQGLGGCAMIQCKDDERCVTDRESGQSACVPLTIPIAPTCDGVRCPEGSACAVYTLPSDPTIAPIATCYGNLSFTIDLRKMLDCNSGLASLLCPESCLSGFQGSRTSGIFCSGCDEAPAVCEPDLTCQELPTELAPIIGINATCSNAQMEFGVDCKSRKELCVGPLYCSEIKLEDTLVGSTCTSVGIHETCELVHCNEAEVCSEIQQNGLQLATCVSRSIFNL